MFIARHHYKTTTVLKYMGGGDGTGRPAVPSCTLSRMNMESFARELLLTHATKLEIWGLADSRKPNSWELIKQASPGNVQDLEDIVFVGANQAFANPVAMAVHVSVKADQRVVGVCFADTSARSLGLSEFLDTELYSNLEALAIQLGVKECLVEATDSQRNYELDKVRTMLSSCNIAVTECRKSTFAHASKDFASDSIEQDLNRLVAAAAIPDQNKHALAAAACLIKYLGLLSDELNFGLYKLVSHSLSSYMRLDASAMRALNLLPSPTDGYNKASSLYGLLDHCKTAQGKRMLHQWLKQPLMNKRDIEERFDVVELLYDDTELRQAVRDEHLKLMPDFSRLSKRFLKGNATLQDLVRTYQAIIRLPALIETLQSYAGEEQRSALLTRLFEVYQHTAKMQSLVEETIDLDAIDNHEFMIKADFDPKLKELHEEIASLKLQIDPEVSKAARTLDQELHKTLKLEKNNVNGYHMRLSRTNASVLRGRSGFIELATQKAGVLFTTVRLKQLSDELMEASARYEETQSSLVKELMAIAATYCGVLEDLNAIIARLDVLLSFAHVSLHASTPYIRPILHDRGQGKLVLREARHPCVEMQDDVSFISNDVEVIRGQSTFQIITGPNAGGKSTYIRQIGVIVLMAQVGCFVPCAAAEVPIVDAILARVGAGDSQLKGISTFMAEMLETASILKTATRDSLIVIDELGRGTSTYDGFGLAWAISEHIANNIGAICFFATHFHELTALQGRAQGVKNLHVAAHIGESRDITLLYRVKEGACDQSFGIHVAEMVGFPPSVVNLAKRKAAELEDFETHASGAHAQLTPEQEERGNQLIEQFLSEFAAVPGVQDMTDEQLATTVAELKVKYAQQFQHDPFVQHVLQ
ncbi:MSH2 protein [Sorochytrium milnesiophthora]